MERPDSDRTETRPFHVGPWLVHPSLNTLTRDEDVRVAPKVMQVLCLLAHRPGTVVTREQFMEMVWADEVVGEEALTHAISTLRRILGDTPRSPRFIQTIPKSGYRLVADVRPAETGPPGIPAGRASDREPTPGRRTRVVVAGVLAAVVVVGLGLAGIMRTGLFDDAAPAAYAPLRAVPFTSTPGPEYDPAFSPDGTRLAFVQGAHIYTRLIEAEPVLQLTRSEAEDRHPAWSPDGQFIAFSRSTATTCGIYLVSALGGTERRLIDCAANTSPELAWHPSGAWLAMTDTAHLLGQQTIYLVAVTTRQRVALTTLPEDGHYPGDSSPAFSPDGGRLAFVREGLGMTTLYVQDLTLPAPDQSTVTTTDAPEPVLSLTQVINGVSWTPDGKYLVYSASSLGEAGLWRVGLSGDEPVRLGIENTRATQPALSPQGDHLAFVQEEMIENIWQAVFSTEGTLVAPPAPLITSTQLDLNPQFSPDGTRIAFASNRSGYGEIWITDSAGVGPVQLTKTERAITLMPSWSPDGRRIVFSAMQDGHLDLFTVDVESRLLERLSDAPSQDGAGRWSPDGQWLYFVSDRNGAMQGWRMPAAGGSPALIVRAASLSPTPSADGRTVYYSKIDMPGIWRRPVEEGDEEQVVADLAPGDWNNWVLYGETLYYLTRSNRDDAVLSFFNLEQGRGGELLKLPHAVPEVAGLSVYAEPSGTHVLFTVIDDVEADIMLVQDILTDKR